MAEPRADPDRVRRCLVSPFKTVRLHGLKLVVRDRLLAARGEVVARLGDPEAEVRREAARAAGDLRLGEAAGALAERLEDPVDAVATEAAAALARVQAGPAPQPHPGPAPAGAPGADPDREPAVPGDLDASDESLPLEAVGRPRGPWDEGAPAPPVRPAEARGPARAPARAPAMEPGRPLPPAPPGRSLRLEVLILVALVGFMVGRGLPGRTPETLPPADRDQARELLFPGSDAYSRLGLGASLVIDGRPEGSTILAEALDDMLFPAAAGMPAPLRLPEPRLDPRRDQDDDPFPDPPEPPGLDPGPAVPPGPATPPPVGAAPPGPVTPLPAGTVRQAPGTASGPLASGPAPRPRAVDRAELELFLAGARRYRDDGDIKRARLLLSQLEDLAPGHPEVLELRRTLWP